MIEFSRDECSVIYDLVCSRIAHKEHYIKTEFLDKDTEFQILLKMKTQLTDYLFKAV